MRLHLAAITLWLAVSGCGEPPPAPTATPSNGPDPATFHYSCAGPPGFLPTIVEQPGKAELENHPSAEGLRAFLRDDSLGLGYLPDAGWWLESRSENEAQYIALLPEGLEAPFGYVTMQRRGDSWAFASGGSCQPQIVLEGRVPVVWSLPLNHSPQPSTVEFIALATDLICTGGQPVGERLLPPVITYTGASVFVVFSARPYQGLTTCEGKPTTEAVVRLREPLGNRSLLDAGVFPPAKPLSP